MNQVIQPLSLASEFPLPSEQQECSDHIGLHAHHSSFAASVPDQLRRDGALGSSSSTSLLHLPSASNVRPIGYRPEPQYHTAAGISDSSSTSPSSNASSIAFSSFSSSASGVFPHQPALNHLTNTYSTPSQLYHTPGYSQPSFMTSSRPRMSSISDSSSGMLPPAHTRSPGMGNPVSPSMGGAARENYTTSTPGLHRHALSPRHPTDPLSRSTYGSLPDTPRSVLPTTMALNHSSTFSGANAMISYAQHDRPSDTPPFHEQETYYDITCEGQTVTSHIEAKIEKGFFMSGDSVWTCYRRNYFTVGVSYTLQPHVPNGRLYLNRGKQPEQIQAMAMTLAAAVDGSNGKTIELIQHTPKRDKGPQLPMKKELLSPTPPGKTQESAYGVSNFHAATTLAGPTLPLQSESEQSHSYSPAGHTTTPTQHTFERIQFKSATANNGKRRAQQQFYHLIVELWANVQSTRDSSPVWVKVAQRVSQPVVVRGRSPSHYSNEGPHSASASRGGSGAGPGGPGYHGGSGAGMGGGYGRSYGNGMSGAGSTGMSGGMYRGGNTYSLNPSPAGSHSVSSASSLSGGPGEGVVGDHRMMDEDEGGKPMESYDGYQYYPAPIYESNLPKVETTSIQDSRRIKEEYPGTVLATGWQVGGCGRFQGMESSRGYYPTDLHTHASY